MAPLPPPGPAADLRTQLLRWPPFAQMTVEHVDQFVQAAASVAFPRGATVLSPVGGAVTHLLLIRHGRIGRLRSPEDTDVDLLYESGELLPIGAALGGRTVTAVYTAVADTECLQLPLAAMHRLVRDSAPFADFLGHHLQHLLELSRRALQAAHATQALAEQSLDTPLRELLQRAPVAVAPATALADALRLMHERRVGSVLVLAENTGAALGILTRHDVVDRVALAACPLGTPISQVMSAPVVTLGLNHTAQDAALAMSRHGIRHLAVADEKGRVVGIVSERDLFALQRLSLSQLSVSIRSAPDVATLRTLAPDIRRFARNLLGQGVGARQLTELISHLNDLLTSRLVTLLAAARGIDLSRGCWLAFGSEGRSEQTVATDQDNGIVFTSDDPSRDRLAWLVFAREVNQALDACGYPLCKGNVMASNPECCLTQDEWLSRFDRWIEHGAPEDLLNASIYFDLRALAGNQTLVLPLRALLDSERARTPRFLRQLADTALRNRAPLTWRGAVDTRSLAGHDTLDLKRFGSAIFVDAARLFALAHGVAATNTRARLEGMGRALALDPRESEAWLDAFDFLQMLRLRVQLERGARGALDVDGGNPNLVAVDELNDIDRRVLAEALRVARALQQRIELDYRR